MAITAKPVRGGEDVWGKSYAKLFDITLDTSYPLTTGYVINATDMGLKGFFGAQVVGGNKASGAVLPSFDLGSAVVTGANLPPTSLALRVFLPTGGATAPATLTAPVVAGTGLSLAGTATGTIPAGATPVTSTAANGAIVSVPATGLTISGSGTLTAGIGKEAGNTTDLSSITIRVRFVGM